MPLGLKTAYKPSINVKEARKLLGKESQVLTDAQVNEIITILSQLAKNYLRNNSSKI